MENLGEFLGLCQEPRAICESHCHISHQRYSSRLTHPWPVPSAFKFPLLGADGHVSSLESGRQIKIRAGKEERAEFHEPKMRV